MEIAEVVDWETLRAYFVALPNEARREVSLRVASNAVARVLPVAAIELLTADWASNHNLTPAAIFGAAATSRVAYKISNQGVAAAAAAASARAAEAAACAYAAIAEAKTGDAAAKRAAYAIDASSYAASATAAYAGYAADAATAGYASVAAVATITEIDFWQLVRLDLAACGPLWPDGPPAALRQLWAETVVGLQAHPDDWTIWIHWYDRVFLGRNWHPEAMSEVLGRITSVDWEKGPKHINPMFDDVLALYLEEDAAKSEGKATDDAAAQLIEATPLAEDVIFDPARQVLTLQPTDRVDEDYLSDVRTQIMSACDIFDHIASPTNAAGALSEELKILRRALEQNPDRPVIQLRTVSRVLGRLDHKVKQFVCPSPEEDANVNDFRDVLTNVRLDLIALSPEVRKYHEATKPHLSNDAVASAVEAARSVASVSDAELAEVIEQETGVLGDTSQDDTARRNAFYRLAGLIARGYRAVREATKEGAGFVKDASIIAGGLTAGGTGVAWFLSPAFRETINTLLRSFAG